jgi:molybdenum cofactor biosynthesis enzyme MoaA
MDINIKDYEIFKQNSYQPFSNNGNDYLLNREPYLDIVLSDYCNANCSFCIADLIHNKLTLDLTQAKQKIEFAMKYMNVKEVLLLGGEPTMSKQLVPFIKHLSTLGLNKICMTTNGILLAHNDKLRNEVLSSGLTHLNVSLMSINDKQQHLITQPKGKQLYYFPDVLKIAEVAHSNNIKVRINNNIFKGNNNTLRDVVHFYNCLHEAVDSVKFSPLLKTDSFSVIDIKTKWVNEHILSDEEYDTLFQSVEDYYSNALVMSIITNEEQFGFVKNSMIPLATPIILNWNQHGQMMNKVVNEHKINNLKILPNGELSLSWNREMTQYYIKTT